ncbi:hypothetical protein Zmor_014625 [Zophobas morio]|uniref:Uncharacterized protein n=1 Tax=Zophobas morio TaxID=2755281 RepID=A0AA38IK90_9CUCU|nr:hypothetical protein Zmor_014625 [Zophobas morio]
MSLPFEIKEAAANVVCSLLPDKSKTIYEKFYKRFSEWFASKKIMMVGGPVLYVKVISISQLKKRKRPLLKFLEVILEPKQVLPAASTQIQTLLEEKS